MASSFKCLLSLFGIVELLLGHGYPFHNYSSGSPHSAPCMAMWLAKMSKCNLSFLDPVHKHWAPSCSFCTERVILETICSRQKILWQLGSLKGSYGSHSTDQSTSLGRSQTSLTIKLIFTWGFICHSSLSRHFESLLFEYFQSMEHNIVLLSLMEEED